MAAKSLDWKAVVKSTGLRLVVMMVGLYLVSGILEPGGSESLCGSDGTWAQSAAAVKTSDRKSSFIKHLAFDSKMEDRGVRPNDGSPVRQRRSKA